MYLPTEQDGFLYLAVLLDVFGRSVVGWSMQERLRTELVLAALEMAVAKQRPEPGLIHHSDHGCQYTPSAMATGVGRREFISVSPRSSTFVNLLGPPVKARCRADAVGLALERSAVGKLHIFQLLDRRKVAVDERAVGQRP